MLSFNCLWFWEISMIFLLFLSSHTIQPDNSFPPCNPPSTTFPLPAVHCSSVSLHKRAALPVVSKEHSTTKRNKTKHNLHIRAVWRNKEEEQASKSRQKSQRHPHFYCQEFHKNTRLWNLTQHSFYLSRKHKMITMHITQKKCNTPSNTTCWKGKSPWKLNHVNITGLSVKWPLFRNIVFYFLNKLSVQLSYILWIRMTIAFLVILTRF